MPPPVTATPPPDIAPDRPRGALLRHGFIALSYRNYRLLWTGQIASVTGTWMQTLAQAWLVYEVLGANAFQLGLVNVLQFLPVLLIGIPAGVLADRFPKRSLMMVTQSTMMVLAMTTATLVFTDLIQLWHVFVIATLFGIANAVDMPARQSFVSELVGRDALMNAIALNSALFNAGRIVGPAIAGVLLALWGPGPLFALNAVSYISVLIALSRIRYAPRITTSTDSPLARLRDGLRYVRATPEIFRTVVMVGMISIFGMNFQLWVPVLASDEFGAGSNAYGALFSAMGVGSLAGALSIAFFGRGAQRKILLGGVALMGTAEIALAIFATAGATLLFGAVALAAVGFSSSSVMSTANSTVQTTADDAYRGRVMAVYMTVFAGTIPFGAMISGVVTNQFGAPVSIAMGGTIVLLVALVLLALPLRQPGTRTATVGDAPVQG